MSLWHTDPDEKVQGPFELSRLRRWFESRSFGSMSDNLLIWVNGSDNAKRRLEDVMQYSNTS